MMGLSSGMDTEFIIQQTMRMHQMRIDSQFRSRKNLLWRQEIQTSVRDQISSFRNTFLTNMGATGMLNRNMYSAVSATATGKNAGAVSVRAIGGATLGTIRIEEIASLARGAHMTSKDRVSGNGQGFSMSAKLDSLKFADDREINWGPQKATVGGVTVTQAAVNSATWSNATSSTFKIGDTDAEVKIKILSGGEFEVTIDDGTNTFTGTLSFVDGQAKIDDVSPGGEALADALSEQLTQQDGVIRNNNSALEFTRTASIKGTDDEDVEVVQHGNSATVNNITNGDFRIDGTRLSYYRESQINIAENDIIIRSDMTITSMLNHINSQLSGTDLKMNYDNRTDRFSIESSSITAPAFEAGGQALEAFGFVKGTGETTYTSTAGTQAEMTVVINGIRDTIRSDTNTFNIGGAMITVNNTMVSEGSEPVEPITVSVVRDVTDAVDRIKSFISAYNSIIQRIESLTRERKSPHEVSYGPLTDEEKASMTDRQIEEWEAIAKKGLLRNDQGLQNLARNLRNELFEQVKAVGMTPQQIGLSTGRFDSGLGGQIVLDEDKLRAALEDDPEKVADIFAGTDENRGLLWRMNDLMGDFVTRSQPRTLRNLEDSIRRASEQMNKMQERMYAEEDRLYKMFAAMETALSRMQSQGDWFNSMLGGLQQK